MATHRFLALDVGSATIKLAELARSPSGGIRLLNYGYADVGAEGAKEEERSGLIVAAIQSILRKYKIRPAPAIIAVSGQQVFTRFTKLPPVDPDKVSSIMRYEAQQNVPIPIEELVWDYQITSGQGSTDAEVALVAIKANIVEELVRCVEEAGLEVEVIDVSPMALYNCVRYNYGDPEGCVVLADIGGRTTNLVFIEKSKLYSRSFPIGGNAFTQAIAQEFNISFAEADKMKRERGFVASGPTYEAETEEQARLSQVLRSTMNRLEGELRRTINLYRSQQGGSAPSLLLLSGASTMISDVDEYFRDKYPGVVVEFFNPFKSIEIAETLDKQELAHVVPFFGEVVGLGLRNVAKCHMEVNLLPPSVQARRAAAAKRPWLAAAAVLVLLTIAVWHFLNTKSLLNAQRKGVEDLNTQINQYQSATKNIQTSTNETKTLEGNIDQVAALVAANDWWTRLLTDINKRVDILVWVSKFRPFLPADPTVGAGRLPPAGLPIAVAPPVKSGGTEYLLECTGLSENKVKSGSQVAQDILKLLRESEFVQPDEKSTYALPVVEPKDGEYLFTIRIKVTLKKPSIL